MSQSPLDDRTSPLELGPLDYEFITGNWSGPAGAAFNCIGEDLYEAGYIDHFGFVTPQGYRAIAKYENGKDVGDAE